MEVLQPSPYNINEDYLAGSDILLSITVRIPVDAPARELYLSLEAGDLYPAIFAPRFVSAGGGRQSCRNSPNSPKVSVEADLLIIDHTWVNSAHPGTGRLRSDGKGSHSGITISAGDTGENAQEREVVYSGAFAVVCDDDLVEEQEQLTVRAWLMPKGHTARSTPVGAFARSILIIDDDTVGPPHNLVLSLSGTTVTASWDEPDDTGSVHPDGYILRYREVGPGDDGWKEIVIPGGDTLTHNVTGLTRERTYRFQVRSTRAGSRPSEWSEEQRIGITTVNDPAPGVPQNVSLAANDTSLVLSWDEPANYRDFPSLTYEVEFRRDGGPWFSTGVEIAGTSASLTGARGSSYQGRVLAASGAARSAWASAGPITVPDAPEQPTPSAPLNLTLWSEGGDLIAAWDEPQDAEQIAVIGYTLRFRGTGINDRWHTRTLDDEALQARIRASYGIELGGRYRAQVRATGTAGNGPWSAEAETTLPTGGPKPVITTDVQAPANRPFTINITFTEPVTGFTIKDLDIDGGTASNFAGTGAAYTAGITPTGSSGTLTIDIPAGAATNADKYGSEAADTFAIETDVTAPTGTITAAETGPYRNPFRITMTFSEPIQDLTVEDFSVTLGQVGNLAAAAGSNTEYTAVATPAGSGTLVIEIGAQTFYDFNGHRNEHAIRFEAEIDTIRPAVTITSTTPPPVNGPFVLTFTFSEDVTGFERDDIEFPAGAGFMQTLHQSGRSYTGTARPTVTGQVLVRVPENAAWDAIGHGNEQAEFEITAIVDEDPNGPTVDIWTPATGPVRGPFELRISFSKPVVGMTADALTVKNGEIGALIDNQAARIEYSTTLWPERNGPVAVNMAAGAVTDDMNNPNIAAPEFSIEALPTPVPAVPTVGLLLLGAALAAAGWRQPADGPRR